MIIKNYNVDNQAKEYGHQAKIPNEDVSFLYKYRLFPLTIVIYQIMQGRKLSHNIRNKQKLVIERAQGQDYLCLPHNLTKNASVFKLMHNKQNQKEGLKPIEHQSLEKKAKPQELKVRALYIRRTSAVSIGSRKSSKSIQDHNQPVDKQVNYEQIQTLLNRLENSSHHSDKSSLSLPTAKMRRVLSLVLEEHYTNIKKLEQLQNRINLILQQQQFPSILQNDSSETHDTTNPNHCKLTIARVLNQKFYTDPPKERKSQEKVDVEVDCIEQVINYKELCTKMLSLDSNICSYKLLIQKQKRDCEKSHLVLEHLSQLNNYILNQPNKILHQAFRRHRYLEEQLFAYADLLSISKVGANTYTVYANIPQTQKMIDSSLRQVNREIIQGDYPIEQKCRMLRDFALKVQQFYRPILDELMKVIDKKTQHSRTFVFKVLKWQENYITRKEFLNNLKTDYSTALVSISQKLALLQSETCSSSTTKGLAMEIQQNMAMINNAFMLGNSFY